jgi:hypothetical protein
MFQMAIRPSGDPATKNSSGLKISTIVRPAWPGKTSVSFVPGWFARLYLCGEGFDEVGDLLYP